MFNKYIVDPAELLEIQKLIKKFCKTIIKYTGEHKRYVATNYLSTYQFSRSILDKAIVYGIAKNSVDEIRGFFSPTGYAYLFIPEIIEDLDDISNFNRVTSIIINIIKYLHSKNPIGWVFDFRCNTGGIIYTYIAAFSILLDKFEVVAKDKYGKHKLSLIYDGYEIYTLNQVTKEKESLGLVIPVDKIKIENVHVFIGRETASCGELLTYLLRKQYNAKLYGAPTVGIPTWMEYYPLDDIDKATNVTVRIPELLFEMTDCVKIKIEKIGGVLHYKIIPDIIETEIDYKKFGLFFTNNVNISSEKGDSDK